MAREPVPARPSLEFDRKRAKALLRAARAGDPQALERFRTHHPRFRGPATTPGATGIALHDAQLVVAREYGVASWARWKQFVETRRLDIAGRAAELVRAACAGDMRKASMLVDAEPALADLDVYTAAVCGAAERMRDLLAREPWLATRVGGPLQRAPILYACFSRFLRSDRRRADGIVQVVQLLLDHGADPNAHYTEGDGADHIQTCLYGAAGIANNAELTRMLLDAGADPNELAPDPEDCTDPGPLGTEALYHASEWSDVACLRLLLEAAPPLHRARVSYCLARMLDFENPAGVELYLANGADPDFRVPWMHRRTHLHRAIAYDRSLTIVRLLVEAGADVNARDDLGMTPLRYAVRHGRDDVIAMLQSSGADDAAVTDDDRSIGAAVRGDATVSSPLSADPDLLCNAACRDDVVLIRRLLEAGADPNAPVGRVDAMPPLHWACWYGRRAAAQALIEAGADIHAVNQYGGDALGSTLHGSVNCGDPVGGLATRLPEEIIHGDYPGLAELLITAGARVPERTGGSEAVQEVLRRHGVRDADA